jgi:DNA-binding IclR family transcriptional regulator
MASIAGFKEAGFCISVGDIHPARYAVAVPLPDRVEGERIVFNCTVHSYQSSREHLVSELGPLLCAMVEQVQSSLRR